MLLLVFGEGKAKPKEVASANQRLGLVDQVLLAALTAIGGFTAQHFIVATNGERVFTARTAVVEGFALHRGNRKRVGGFWVRVETPVSSLVAIRHRVDVLVHKADT